ncbi:MAG: hypothetical protein ACSHWW_00410 [Nonlabens sp.]|uniref:hypothetical protein n=1 Tax=Nonlabens sp. TaxID=1888209 RepID=UPI003EF515C5
MTNKTRLFLKIIIPIFLLSAGIYLLEIEYNRFTENLIILYYPISFGLVVGLVNNKNHRYNYWFNTFLSLVIAALIFFTVFLIPYLIDQLQDYIRQSDEYYRFGFSKEDLLFISAFYVAPILVFLGYGLIFKIRRNIAFLGIVIMTIFCMFLIKNNIIGNQRIEFLEEGSNSFRFLHPYVLWQLVMVFGLQITIHQKELIEIILGKKE